jgi:GntR family transcriptional regulator of vanillate catabolism
MSGASATSEPVFARLRDLILQGGFAAGERLTEVRLAEILGVSRTPVRIALVELEHAGLVQGIAGGGYAMRRFTSAEVRDVMTVRGSLEGLAARLAAERGLKPEHLAALRVCLAEGDRVLAEATQRTDPDYATVNERFHSLLAEASGNGPLRRAIELNSGMPFGSPNAMLPVQATIDDHMFWLRTAHVQHHWIVDAMVAREGHRAQTLAEEHARIGRRALDRALATPTKLTSVYPALELRSDG